MRTPLSLVAALSLATGSPVLAQRQFRVGPSVSSLSLEDLSGKSHSFTAFGGTAALITRDDGEVGLAVARYHDLSTDGRVRRLTLFGLESYYYPVGTHGVAPFASTALGLARVTETGSACLLGLCSPDTVATASQFALAFGLGLRANLGTRVVATVEGRFLQVPGSQIQALEARASAAVALGPPRTGEFVGGTLGPVVGVWIPVPPVSASLRGRAPFVGVRFRRDTKQAGTVALQLDFAPLKLTGSCMPAGCEQPNAILFAPGYERSAWRAWGRLYGEAGLLLVGVYTQGPDRGVAPGLHGGVGVDLYSAEAMWNVNSRLLWVQRTSGEHVFGVQLGLSLSPKLGRPARSRGLAPH